MISKISLEPEIANMDVEDNAGAIGTAELQRNTCSSQSKRAVDLLRKVSTALVSFCHKKMIHSVRDSA